MPSIDKLRHNIRHAVSLSAFSPNLIHRIRYFFLCTVTFRDYSLTRINQVVRTTGWAAFLLFHRVSDLVRDLIRGRLFQNAFFMARLPALSLSCVSPAVWYVSFFIRWGLSVLSAGLYSCCPCQGALLHGQVYVPILL